MNTKAIDAFASPKSNAIGPELSRIATSATSSLRGRRMFTQAHSTIQLGAGSEASSLLTPKAQYDSIICGGGPAGLLSAIMLSQKFGPLHRIAVCERRPTIPPSPTDDTVWNDVARFYLLGIGHRGQTALRAFGVYDDFEKVSVAVNGRRDWQPGMTKIEDSKITPAKKDVVSRVLPRDKLVGLLYHHIIENYAGANIDLLYGYDVEPMSFGNDDDKEEDFVTVRISKCEEVSADGTYASSQDSEQLCSLDGFSLSTTTKLLIGADGSARTVANAMERFDAERISKLNPIQRLLAEKPFKVTRFEDDNPRVFKSVPIRLPAEDWPHDLNYSARSRDSRITLEALPSDDKGSLCALLLMKPQDEFAQSNVDPKKLRSFFDEEFPQFGALISEEEIERVATKSASALPAFRFAGPRLNMGKRTLILGGKWSALLCRVCTLIISHLTNHAFPGSFGPSQMLLILLSHTSDLGPIRLWKMCKFFPKH
jgi:kynurenine 3-monooxygenase